MTKKRTVREIAGRWSVWSGRPACGQWVAFDCEADAHEFAAVSGLIEAVEDLLGVIKRASAALAAARVPEKSDD